MARFTLPRDVYHGKGSLENLKALKGKKAVIVVGGGSMKRFGFLDRAEGYLKEAGFEVMDHIRVYFAQNDKIKALVDSNNAEIKDEVLANEICFDTIKGYNKEWNINGETVVIGVEKENA